MDSIEFCGTTWNYDLLGADIYAAYLAMPVGQTLENFGCGYPITRTETGFTLLGIALTVTGNNRQDGINAISAYGAYTCGGWDGYKTAPANCCGTPVSAGYDCFGSNCADGCDYVGDRDCDRDGSVDSDMRLCPYMQGGYDCVGTPEADPGCMPASGYDCGTNGGTDGNFIQDGKIDNNASYCPKMTAGYDCYATNGNCADAGCKYISGYDCGTNGGAPRNQTPDLHVDNRMEYCPYVEAGWDCSGASCDGNHPAYNDFSDNGIAAGGTCNNTRVLADLECKAGAWSCSRRDEPGRCGSESVPIIFDIPIRNKGDNDYQCRAEDKAGPRLVHEFDYPEEQRFLPEGCRETLNEIYFSGGVPLVDFGFEVPYEYIRYEDLIAQVARKRCEWRDSMSMASCAETPFHDANRPDYISIENLSNPSLRIIP